MGVVMVTRPYLNFAVCCDAVRPADLSTTADPCDVVDMAFTCFSFLLIPISMRYPSIFLSSAWYAASLSVSFRRSATSVVSWWCSLVASAYSYQRTAALCFHEQKTSFFPQMTSHSHSSIRNATEGCSSIFQHYSSPGIFELWLDLSDIQWTKNLVFSLGHYAAATGRVITYCLQCSDDSFCEGTSMLTLECAKTFEMFYQHLYDIHWPILVTFMSVNSTCTFCIRPSCLLGVVVLAVQNCHVAPNVLQSINIPRVMDHHPVGVVWTDGDNYSLIAAYWHVGMDELPVIRTCTQDIIQRMQ